MYTHNSRDLKMCAALPLHASKKTKMLSVYGYCSTKRVHTICATSKQTSR